MAGRPGDSVTWICSCGQDVTPVPLSQEGWFFHYVAGHRISEMPNMTFKTMASHKSWEYPTPTLFYEELNKEFHFDFDPCPLGGDKDGRSTLFCSWKGKRVFCNPPYGPQIPDFLRRWNEAVLAVFLVPARTDTKWFHEIALPHAKEIRFIRGRLKFGGSTNPAPFPSMVLIFEANP